MKILMLYYHLINSYMKHFGLITKNIILTVLKQPNG